MPSEEPRWDPRLDRDPHRARSFFTTPDGRRTYLVPLVATVGVTARIEKMLGKVRWSVIRGRGRPQGRNADRDQRWADGVAKCLEDLQSDYEEDCDIGANGTLPTIHLARIELFHIDCPKHPEDWPRHYRLANGEANPKLDPAAADLIRKATTKTPAKPAETKRS